MSYIRITSNPEGLYVYDSGKCVTICYGKDKKVKVNKDDFKYLVLKYRKTLGEDFITTPSIVYIPPFHVFHNTFGNKGILCIGEIKVEFFTVTLDSFINTYYKLELENKFKKWIRKNILKE